MYKILKVTYLNRVKYSARVECFISGYFLKKHMRATYQLHK